MQAKVGLWEHFRKLAAFGGREDRTSFWPWAALVLGILMIAGSLMTLPMISLTMMAAPRPAVPAPPAGFLAAYLAATFALAVLLYAASVVRRLHDRGKSGRWGLLPLPFYIYASVQSVRLIGSGARGEQPDPTLLLTAAAGNVVWWAALLALVVLLAGPSDPLHNRYDTAA